LGVITIQGTLQERLSRILGHPVCVHGSGRTDAVVHSKGQTAHFRTGNSLPPAVIMRALNALLPDDIVILEAEEMHSSFHAQFDAREKNTAITFLSLRDQLTAVMLSCFRFPQSDKCGRHWLN
jgi:tRNA pseudouridine38-40 synthase